MMKRFALLTFASLVALCAGFDSPSAQAKCRVRTKVVAQVVATQVAVPLAVAIGVPVAEVTPYYYSYAAYGGSSTPNAVDLDALADKVAARLRTACPPPSGPTQNPTPTPQLPSSPPAPASSIKTSAVSIIQQRCAVCHSQADPKGNLSLASPAALDPASRLKAIRAVLSEKMPKDGPPLTPEEAGQALEELAGQ